MAMRLCVALLGASLAMPPLVCAQEADAPARVARLADAEGAVSVQPAGLSEWISAEINRPLTRGDQLWCDEDSRAELDLGDAFVRLGSHTAFAFFNLDDRSAQLQLTVGTLIAVVHELPEGMHYEVDTPSVAVTLLAPGQYRIEVNAADSTTVKVSTGSMQVDGGGESVAIGTQQMATFVGQQSASYQVGPLQAGDDFDAWSLARDQGLANLPADQYVAEQVPGHSELDASGYWQSTPVYGAVWVPTLVGVGWVPFRHGHWVWVSPWGWTWIDDARWGFAPAHYGRWVQWNGAWCWVPGPPHVHPVYAPAQVGWVTGAPQPRSAQAVAARLGWFPLSPRDVYVPAYAVSGAYLSRVNMSNTRLLSGGDVAAAYQHRVPAPRYENASTAGVTVVTQQVFVSGQRLGTQAGAANPAWLSSALVGAAAPALAPTRQSALGPLPAYSVPRPPPAYLNRAVLVRTPPPAAAPPFERQLTAIHANGDRPLSRGELTGLQPPRAAAPVRVLPGGARQARAPAVPVSGLDGAGREFNSAAPRVLPGAAPVSGSVLAPDPPRPAARTTPGLSAPPAAGGVSVRAQVPAAAPPALPATAPPATHAAPSQSAPELRDTGPHGDRDTRERLQR